MNLMTVEDNNFNIKNGLSVGTGKHQVLDSNARITANYFTLNTGGRYLSAGVDLYDLISTQGVPPVSTNAWNHTHDRVLLYGDNWDSVYSWVKSDSATNNTLYNLTHFIHITGGRVADDFGVGGETYLEGSLRVDGHTYLSAAMYVENDVHVMGNLRADGDVWLAVEGVYPKTVYVGATNDDNIVFVADVSSNFIPDEASVYDLGTVDQQWYNLFVQDVSASRDVWVGNDLMVSANGTIGNDFRISGHQTVSGNTTLSGTLDVKEFTTLHDDLSVKGDLYVDGNAYLSAGIDGNIYVGDTNTDNVVFNADIDSGLTPNEDVTFDLGTNTQQWRELFVQDISATSDVFVDNDLLVSANGTIGTDFRVSGHTTVGGDTVLSGTLDVDDATYVHDTLDVELDTRLHDDLLVTGNTTVSGNTVLSGTLDVQDFVTFYDDLSVRGDLYVDGNAYLSAGTDGNIYVGDTDGDNVVFRADINSNLIPEQHHIFDIGTDDKHWNTLFVNDISANGDVKINQTLFVDQIRPDLETKDTVDINAGTINLQSGDSITDGSGMAITSDRIRFNSDRFTFGDIRETADGWRPWVLDMNVDDQTAILSATLTGELDATFEQNLTVLGDTTLGNSNTDNVVFVADVDSNIIPDDDVTYDLGTNTQQWRELFVHDISASNDIFVDNDLLVSANGTIGQDFRVSGHTTISGNTTLSGTLAVDDTTYIYDTLDVELKTTLHDDLLVSGDTHIVGDLRVDGNAYLSAGVDGIINVGDKNTDNVVFHADIDSGITPNLNITYDLGTNTQQWRTLYVQDISATSDVTIDENLTVSGNTTVGGDTVLSGHLDVELDTRLHKDLYVTGNTTVSGNTTLSGTLDVDDATYVYDTLDVELDTRLHNNLFVTENTTISGDTHILGDLRVDGSAYLSAGVDGIINVGDNNTDNVVFHADVDSGITPNKNITYDLGTNTQQWETLYVQDVSATGNVTVDDNLAVSGNATVGGDTVLSGYLDVELDTQLQSDLFVTNNTTISGNTVLSGTLDVKDLTTIHGHVSAVSGMSLTGNLTAEDDVYIKGSIVVEGHAYFGFGSNSGTITLGDPSVDEVIFQADVGSDILPYPTNTYNIGSLSKRWLTLYVSDLDVYQQIYTRGDIITNSSIIQRKPPDQDPSDIETAQDLWKGFNGRTGYAEVSIPTFDCTKYQSAQFVVMVKDETGTNITTVNADFACNGTTINGTIYGNVNVGTMDPLEHITCVMNNNRYELKLTISKYAKAVVRGTAIYLQ